MRVPYVWYSRGRPKDGEIKSDTPLQLHKTFDDVRYGNVFSSHSAMLQLSYSVFLVNSIERLHDRLI
jgi:hypothetical protein